MPQAVAGFLNFIWAGVAAVGTAFGLSSGTIMAIWSVGSQLVALTLLNTVYNKLFVPDVATPAHSFNITVRGTVEHQRIIYGETLASGLIWYMNVAGTNNQALHYAIAVAGHRITDITDMWIDDSRIASSNIAWATTGAVTGGSFRGSMSYDPPLYFYKYLGEDSQAASTHLRSAFSEITSSHTGRGIAWFLTRCDYFENQAQVWSAGAPNNIRALVKGKKVYDPRSHSLVASSTWEWSDNPALCWADYMMDDDLGFGESPDRIDWGYVSSAASVCDGIVYTPVGTDKRFRCNGALSTGDDHANNLKMILSAMNGTAVLLNGKWKVRAYAYNTPTLQFNDDDLRGDLQISLNPRERERFNTVRGTFIDKDRYWKSAEFPVVTASEYVARDNNRTLYRDISLHMTKDIYAAQRLATGILEQSDNQITCVVPTNYHTLPVEVGGTIMLSNTKMGWTDKVFRVERYKFQDMGGIDLVVREDSLGAYTDVGTAEYTVSSGGSYLPATTIVPAPSSLTAAGIVEGFNINVTPPAARLYDYIRIYANAISNSQAQAVQIARITNDNYYYPVRSDSIHYFWAKAENYAGALSDFYPNSGQTGVFDSVNTAIFLVQVESTQNIDIPDQTSGWTNAAVITGPTVNAGGAAPIKVDVTLEVNVGHSTAQINDDIRLRFRSNRGGLKSAFGPEKTFTVNSIGGLFTFKGLFETTVNTNDTMEATFLATHPSSLATFHRITHWAMTTKVVPDTSATFNPGPIDVSQKQLMDMISVGDTIVPRRTRQRVPAVSTVTLTDSLNTDIALLNLSGEAVSDITAGSPAIAGIRINSDGTVSKRTSAGYSRIDSLNWITPATEASSRFQVRVSSITYTSGTFNLSMAAAQSEWIHLGSNREYSGRDATTDASGIVDILFQLEVRDGLSALATAVNTYSIYAEYEA